MKQIIDSVGSGYLGTCLLVKASRLTGLSIDMVYRSVAVQRAVSFLDR